MKISEIVDSPEDKFLHKLATDYETTWEYISASLENNINREEIIKKLEQLRKMFPKKAESIDNFLEFMKNIG